jgi:hypothetical protein
MGLDLLDQQVIENGVREAIRNEEMRQYGLANLGGSDEPGEGKKAFIEGFFVLLGFILYVIIAMVVFDIERSSRTISLGSRVANPLGFTIVWLLIGWLPVLLLTYGISRLFSRKK